MSVEVIEPISLSLKDFINPNYSGFDYERFFKPSFDRHINNKDFDNLGRSDFASDDGYFITIFEGYCNSFPSHTGKPLTKEEMELVVLNHSKNINLCAYNLCVLESDIENRVCKVLKEFGLITKEQFDEVKDRLQ